MSHVQRFFEKLLRSWRGWSQECPGRFSEFGRSASVPLSACIRPGLSLPCRSVIVLSRFRLARRPSFHGHASIRKQRVQIGQCMSATAARHFRHGGWFHVYGGDGESECEFDSGSNLFQAKPERHEAELMFFCRKAAYVNHALAVDPEGAGRMFVFFPTGMAAAPLRATEAGMLAQTYPFYGMLR